MFLKIVFFTTICGLNSIQDDQFSGKPGNVREFCSCQENVRELSGECQEKILSGKTVTMYAWYG